MAQPPPQHPQQMAPQQLSREEARVMRECNQESLYRRCVPISAVMMAGTLYMVRSGRWRASPTFGPAPKMAAAGFVGYLVGKFSYIETCKQRLMELPDSKIGQMLRLREQQRQGGWQQDQPGFMDVTAPAEQPSQPQAQQPWAPLPPRGEPAGLDDYYRPTVDSSHTPTTLVTDDLPTAQHTTTYEQLRRQNRAEAEARLRRGTAPAPGPGPVSPSSQPPPAAEPTPRRPPGSTNKYGDAWDN